MPKLPVFAVTLFFKDKLRNNALSPFHYDMNNVWITVHIAEVESWKR